MMSRSRSGSIPKNRSMESTSSRCCPVQRTRHRAQGIDFKAWITGAILIASGRVPMVQRIVLSPSRLIAPPTFRFHPQARSSGPRADDA